MMFEINKNESTGHLHLSGRLDASKADTAQAHLDELSGGASLDLSELEYLSSAGLGVLLKTHKRLMGEGDGLSLVNVNKHICDIFSFSGFDKLFDITPME